MWWKTNSLAPRGCIHVLTHAFRPRLAIRERDFRCKPNPHSTSKPPRYCWNGYTVAYDSQIGHTKIFVWITKSIRNVSRVAHAFVTAKLDKQKGEASCCLQEHWEALRSILRLKGELEPIALVDCAWMGRPISL